MVAEALSEPAAAVPANLPRLLYIGDVPVCQTGSGSVLLFRLLQTYPRDRLVVVEGNLTVSDRTRRLSGIQYEVLPIQASWMPGRLAKYYCYWLQLMAPRRWRSLKSLLLRFRPEAVLTVAHGYSWLAAARLAEAYKLPLHLICHDHWPNITFQSPGYRHWVDRDLRRVYRQAAERYCVSPGMEETYRLLSGARGQILLPARSIDAPRYDSPPERLRATSGSLKIVYAGIGYTPYLKMLGKLAGCVERTGDEVHIFTHTHLDAATRGRTGLDRANVHIHPAVPAERLIQQLRQSADVLLLPLTFEAGLRLNMRFLFPSKLTEYTAAGLPIVIWAPPDSSAVRWALENPGAAVTVSVESAEDVARVLVRIRQDPDYRYSLAASALEAGERHFSHVVADRIFHAGLRRSYSHD